MTPSLAKTRAAGKRKYRRFPVDQPALVSCVAVPGLVRTARIADVSRRGVQLILEQAAFLDAEIRIQWTNKEIRGTVRHQGRRGGQYRVGVALANSRDSLLVDLLARETMALRKLDREAAASAAVLRGQIHEMAGALEAAVRASEIKSRFLASVSHEFRTPLNGIIGFSELLYDAKVGPVNTDQQDYLSDILSCSRHLLTLINQVLDLTKIESGKMDFQYEAVRLEAVAREVMEGVKGLAAGKRIVVGIECDERIGTVRADAARLRQVLFNYLSNALKFTPEDGRIVVRIVPEDPACYRIQVEDNGVGIRPEDLSRLFTEFGQLGTARKAGSGTGLGLAITRRIVEKQGGRVGVESTPGAGSRFWAVLPVHPAGSD
jgi:signal transduction histidine kinase